MMGGAAPVRIGMAGADTLPVITGPVPVISVVWNAAPHRIGILRSDPSVVITGLVPVIPIA